MGKTAPTPEHRPGRSAIPSWTGDGWLQLLAQPDLLLSSSSSSKLSLSSSLLQLQIEKALGNSRSETCVWNKTLVLGIEAPLFHDMTAERQKKNSREAGTAKAEGAGEETWLSKEKAPCLQAA